MSIRFRTLYHVLCLALAAPSAAAGEPKTPPRLGPSDCKARDADSTCATAVAGGPVGGPPSSIPDAPLYDGQLGGVPSSGYAYWGFDFIADATGAPSPVRIDEFINRSNVPVTITLSFDIPTSHPCRQGCLPRVEFEVDKGWFKIDPPTSINGSTASITQTFAPGRGYGWVIGLWQATNPRLTVSVPANSAATLQDVGLSPLPAVASEIAAVIRVCDCGDNPPAQCSDGSHFSNGLLGPWSQEWDNYSRAGAFYGCPSGK
jgi:hypothetical protein